MFYQKVKSFGVKPWKISMAWHEGFSNYLPDS
jgi:hypothetical protein